MLLLFLLLLTPAVTAFAPSVRQHNAWTPALQMSSTDVDVPIVLNGQNIELTPALVEHVNKRIGSQLNKLANNGAVRECDVVLSVNKNPKVRSCALAAKDWSNHCFDHSGICSPVAGSSEANPHFFNLVLCSPPKPHFSLFEHQLLRLSFTRSKMVTVSKLLPT